MPETSLTKEGYTFSGWNTKADGTGTSYTDEQSISLSDNLTLYAQWQINQYNLTYDYNGINVSPITNIYDYNTAASLANCPYSREGYIFTGWNTKADGSGTAYNEYQELRITNDLTLYAQWQEGKGYSSNYYNLDTNKGYVNNISINTNINDYKNSFNLISGYTIDVDYKLVNNVSVLYTGGHTKIYNNGLLINSFVNIVSGDTNGDGKMNYLDYVNVYNHIQKEKHPEINKSLLDGAYKVAGDMSSDNKISYLDYVRIYNKIKELKGGTN